MSTNKDEHEEFIDEISSSEVVPAEFSSTEIDVIHINATDELATLDAQVDADETLTLSLPDGHVLKIAHAIPGTIVEVASWVGSGRPGPDTSRIMIGIGRENNKETSGTVGTEVEVKKVVNQIQISSSRFQKFAKPIAWATVITSLVVGMWFSPLVVVRPTVGSSVGLGATDDSLVVTLPTSSIAEGQNVVAYLDASHSSVILGRINQVTSDAVLIQTDQGFAQTQHDRVIGKVLVVIPYVGAIAR